MLSSNSLYMKRVLKIVLIVLFLIIVLPLIAALFVKKEYQVEKEMVIAQPIEQVFGYLKYLKNQDEFSVWMAMDPDVRMEYTGIDGTVGFVSAWSSEDKNVGAGEQEILAIKENARIDYELRFKEPFQSVSEAYLITEPVDLGQTLVKWGFRGRMNYPMNLMLLLMDFEGMIGKDLHEGLENLKAILESSDYPIE